MGYNIDLRKKFQDYFNELEGFGLRSERFHEEFESGIMRERRIIEWLESAYLRGARDMAQDSVDTLYDYATSLAGIEEIIHTREQSFDAAGDALMVYYTKVLDNAETL